MQKIHNLSAAEDPVKTVADDPGSNKKESKIPFFPSIGKFPEKDKKKDENDKRDPAKQIESSGKHIPCCAIVGYISQIEKTGDNLDTAVHGNIFDNKIFCQLIQYGSDHTQQNRIQKDHFFLSAIRNKSFILQQHKEILFFTWSIKKQIPAGNHSGRA